MGPWSRSHSPGGEHIAATHSTPYAVCRGACRPRHAPRRLRWGRGQLDVQQLQLHVDGQLDQRRRRGARSEEHTSELQSRENLVCRLLLEKKKTNNKPGLRKLRPT